MQQRRGVRCYGGAGLHVRGELAGRQNVGQHGLVDVLLKYCTRPRDSHWDSWESDSPLRLRAESAGTAHRTLGLYIFSDNKRCLTI